MTIRMDIHHRLSIEPGAYSGATDPGRVTTYD